MISVIVISKNESQLAMTLADLREPVEAADAEVIVVDASAGRLDHIRDEFPYVRWVVFAPQPGRVTIPHQRNAGIRAARGGVIVFTDAGCRLEGPWLSTLTDPILAGTESVTAGLTLGTGSWSYLRPSDPGDLADYLPEAATINLAMAREVVEVVGEFDERFEYGSDIDFTWRVIANNFRIRSVPAAVVTHEWGNRRRQLKRSYRYGKARVRLHRKHRTKLRQLVRQDPVVATYPVFLVGLPIAVVAPAYLLLLGIPAWRARKTHPATVVFEHLVFGAGALVEILS